ncbi:hypothetical protein E1301_Tti007095 [Triplophysa tibetana]|uniref:Uncharacterized protein n=1 Tax=Triplophysa tibetana TaxID=1572043 RepID=A0A5A9PN65_9TELE|nr:hypothetical protein E1301_Tti007095 [Triplophysa tibetana]
MGNTTNVMKRCLQEEYAGTVILSVSAIPGGSCHRALTGALTEEAKALPFKSHLLWSTEMTAASSTTEKIQKDKTLQMTSIYAVLMSPVTLNAV